MGKKFIIDTSAWIAYYLSDETEHIKIKNLIKRLIKEHVAIFISNDVIDETITRLVQTTNPKVVALFIKTISENINRNILNQLWVDDEIQTEAFELVQKYSEHKLSLTDATTIALAKKFSIESVISLDSDFIKVGILTLP